MESKTRHFSLSFTLIIIAFTLLLFLIGIFNQVLLPSIASYNFKRIVELSILGVLVFYLLVSNSLRDSCLNLFFSLPGLARSLIAAFFVLGFVATIFAPIPKYSLLGIGLYWLLLTVIFYIASLRVYYGEIYDKGFMLVLLICIFIYCATSLHNYIHCVSYFSSRNACTFHSRFLTPNFMNRRFFSQMLSWTLPIIILPLAQYHKNSKVIKFLLLLLAGYWWALAFVNASRVILIVWPISIVIVLLLCYGRKSFAWFGLQIYAALMGGVIYFLWFFPFWSMDEWKTTVVRQLTYNQDRIALWKATLALIQKHPWLGVGPQNFAYYNNSIAAHPHNSFLTVAVEWGIPAALIAVFLVLWGCLRWLVYSREVINDNNKVMLTSLTAMLTAAIVHSLVSGLIIMPLSQLLLSLMIGWVLGYYLSANQRAVSHSNIYWQMGFMATLLMALAFIAIVVIPVLHHMPTFMLSNVFGHYLPGIWLDGRLK